MTSFSENLTPDLWPWGHWDSNSSEIFSRSTYSFNLKILGDFTTFSQNLTSDLWVKVAEIWTRPAKSRCTYGINEAPTSLFLCYHIHKLRRPCGVTTWPHQPEGWKSVWFPSYRATQPCRAASLAVNLWRPFLFNMLHSRGSFCSFFPHTLKHEAILFFCKMKRLQVWLKTDMQDQSKLSRN